MLGRGNEQEIKAWLHHRSLDGYDVLGKRGKMSLSAGQRIVVIGERVLFIAGLVTKTGLYDVMFHDVSDHIHIEPHHEIQSK